MHAVKYAGEMELDPFSSLILNRALPTSYNMIAEPRGISAKNFKSPVYRSQLCKIIAIKEFQHLLTDFVGASSPRIDKVVGEVILQLELSTVPLVVEVCQSRQKRRL